jgi:hypothetical protein
MANYDEIRRVSLNILDVWVESCTRRGKVARNTISVGIVVLDHMRRNSPVLAHDVISPGGEVKGTRSGLGNVLEAYGIPRNYLKEVTTRQGHQDGQRLFADFDWGNRLAALSDEERDHLLMELIDQLVERAMGWIRRQNLKLNIDRRHAPSSWVNLIVENAKQRSGGVVEQHLVGAKLEKRFDDLDIPNHPAHAADTQTSRAGDFVVSELIYHVTATPSRGVIQKCADNIQVGLHPILLVPRDIEYRATALAQDEGIDKEITIISIEDFVAMNIIELATDESKDFFNVLQEIVQIYNRRLEEVETDMSLRIEIR